jgi:peroxiredoxin
MRKLSSIAILVIATMFSCNQKKEGSFISNMVKEISKTQSIHYKLTQQYYYSSGKDTTITPCEVWVVRDSEDTLRKGFVWVDNNYRPYNMIYNKGNFYLAIPPKKVTAFYPDFIEEFISPVDWIDMFLNPEVLQKQFTNPHNITSLTDTVYNGESCKKVVIKFPAGKNKEKTTHIYIFSKKHAVPLWAMAKTENKEYDYYDEAFFSDYKFDQVDIKKLHIRQEKILAENPLENRTENSELSKLESMLHIGNGAPVFEGKLYTNNMKFELSKYIGKNIIIVDFWYTHCPPCVKAIPSLTKLYKEYEHAGLKIFGLNSVDNQTHSLAYLDKFLSKREINYDVIMIQPEVDLIYKIKQYPTLYVIDKEGKIAFVELGYNEEKFEKLKEKVAELLQNE